MTTKRGEAAAIVPSTTKGVRTKPMTDEEFVAELARMKQQRLQEGKPLTDETMMACGEKAGRIAAHEARTHATIAQDGRKGADRCAEACPDKQNVQREMVASEVE